MQGANSQQDISRQVIEHLMGHTRLDFLDEAVEVIGKGGPVQIIDVTLGKVQRRELVGSHSNRREASIAQRQLPRLFSIAVRLLKRMPNFLNLIQVAIDLPP